MDSVTQIALGSAVGYATLGSKLGRRAILLGAAMGTLPDLDVLINFGGAIENFVYHRSFSHSLICQLLLSPLLAWVLHRFSFTQIVSFKWLAISVFFMLSSHAILDSFTVYGTQLLWPFTDYPFGISSIFIIDPAYSLPLVFGVIMLCFKRFAPWSHQINAIALGVSTVYLVWSIVAKWHIDNHVKITLTEHNIAFHSYVSTPTPFNTFLWRAVATTEHGHFELYVSVFDKPDEISIRFIPTRNDLLENLGNTMSLVHLKEFTKGLYGVYLEQDEIIFSDLRMGLEGFYVFSFVVGQITNTGVIPGDYRQLKRRPPLDGVGLIFDRIFDPDVDLTQLNKRE